MAKPRFEVLVTRDTAKGAVFTPNIITDKRLIGVIGKNVGKSEELIREVISAYGECILEMLEKNDGICLVDHGKFEILYRETSRN